MVGSRGIAAAALAVVAVLLSGCGGGAACGIIGAAGDPRASFLRSGLSRMVRVSASQILLSRIGIFTISMTLVFGRVD